VDGGQIKDRIGLPILDRAGDTITAQNIDGRVLTLSRSGRVFPDAENMPALRYQSLVQ
jgi:hypothetical protein